MMDLGGRIDDISLILAYTWKMAELTAECNCLRKSSWRCSGDPALASQSTAALQGGPKSDAGRLFEFPVLLDELYLQFVFAHLSF